MPESFFKQKKEWSRYKDFILDHYLTPYLEKVKYLNRPVLVVDCCAGPGIFEDGSKGSPLIIADRIVPLYERGVPAFGLFLEKDKKFYSQLQTNLAPYGRFATPKHTDFTDNLDDIREQAQNKTVFLYVDPCGIKELLFSDLASIYENIGKHNSSVEVLLNLNSPALVRCGLAALKMDIREFDLETDDTSILEMFADGTAMTPHQVDAIAGGDYWRAIIADASMSFAEKETAISEAYLHQMTNYFPWACSFPIQRRYGQLPKYRLIYGTRHEDGILLMNDTMYRAREKFLTQEFATGTLFDLRPPSELKDSDLFTNRLFEIVKANGPLSRKDLKLKAMREFFCHYSSSDYSSAVKNLLSGWKDKKLFSASGNTRINDNELLWTKSFK